MAQYSSCFSKTLASTDQSTWCQNAKEHHHYSLSLSLISVPLLAVKQVDNHITSYWFSNLHFRSYLRPCKDGSQHHECELCYPLADQRYQSHKAWCCLVCLTECCLVSHLGELSSVFLSSSSVPSQSASNQTTK